MKCYFVYYKIYKSHIILLIMLDKNLSNGKTYFLIENNILFV